MIEELKYINNKLHAWSEIWEKYIKIELCQQCGRKYMIPGILYAICSNCREDK